MRVAHNQHTRPLLGGRSALAGLWVREERRIQRRGKERSGRK